MSRSSLWVMNKEFNGFEEVEFQNSWWFSPVVWDVLLDKYMHDAIQTPFGYKKSLIGLDGNNLSNQLNVIVNLCENFPDRVCWELSNQQVFFTKDKEAVAKAIRDFAENNTSYYIHEEEGKSVLTFEHIAERFNEIADSILALDETHYPYFIFKNTSVDDGVEYWFEKYEEETDEYTSSTLKEIDKNVTEFVVIKGGSITGFTRNLDFFKEEAEELN